MPMALTEDRLVALMAELLAPLQAELTSVNARLDVVELLDFRQYTEFVALPLKEAKQSVIDTFQFAMEPEWSRGGPGVLASR